MISSVSFGRSLALLDLFLFLSEVFSEKMNNRRCSGRDVAIAYVRSSLYVLKWVSNTCTQSSDLLGYPWDVKVRN